MAVLALALRKPSKRPLVVAQERESMTMSCIVTLSRASGVASEPVFPIQFEMIERDSMDRKRHTPAFSDSGSIKYPYLSRIDSKDALSRGGPQVVRSLCWTQVVDLGDSL